MKHIIYISKCLATLFLLIIPAQILGYFVVAIALLFKIKDKRVLKSNLNDQRLPKFLSIWDNADDLDIKYGLNGDIPHQNRWISETKDKWYHIYAMRYTWLAIRNPVNGLKRNFLGKDKNLIADTIEYISKPDDYYPNTEVGDWTMTGYRYSNIKLSNGQHIKEYYLVKLLPKFMWTKDKVKCIRIRIGYKIGHRTGHNTFNGYMMRNKIQFVVAIQPYKTYLGKIAKASTSKNL